MFWTRLSHYIIWLYFFKNCIKVCGELVANQNFNWSLQHLMEIIFSYSWRVCKLSELKYIFINNFYHLFLLHYLNPQHVFCLVNIFSTTCYLQTELMCQSSTEVCPSVEFHILSLKFGGSVTTGLLKHMCRPPQHVAQLLILWIPTEPSAFLV